MKLPICVLACGGGLQVNGMAASLRQRILQGGKAYGSLLMSNSPIVAELMGGVGYDFLVVDHEHSPTDVASGQLLLQGIRSANTATEPIVRVPSPCDKVYMKKVLDSLRLPGGVLVPMIEDAGMAKSVVESIRYPTQEIVGTENSTVNGVRGCAAPLVRGSGWGLDSDYLRRCVDDLLVMVQVETPNAVQNIDEIASVEGIDMIFLGPLDLSASIGKMGQFQDPAVQALIQDAEQRVVESPCLLGGFRPPGRDVEGMMQSAGYSLVAGSVDLALLRDAANRDRSDVLPL